MLLESGSSEIPILSATVTWAQRGPWVADAILDDTKGPTGAAALRQGAVSLRGTLRNPGAFAGRAGGQLVAGAGKLGEKVQPRQYRGAPLSLILGDLGADSGEAIRATTADVGGTIVQNWARPAESPTRVLDELCQAMGADYAWRTNDAGTVLVGPETWPAVTPRKARVLDEDAAAGLLTVDDELLELRPGTTWDGRRIASVQVQWGRARTRTKVWLARETARGVGDAIARAVEVRLPSPVWTRLHPSRVHSQDADGSLQVFPDDAAVPPMVGVQLRTGIPGLEVEVIEGARVLLAFEEGDPRRPIALPAFDGDPAKLKALHITATTEISVNAPTVRINDEGGDILLGNTPANPIARVGDIVQVTLALVVPDPTQGVALTSPAGPVTGTIGTPILPVIAAGQIVSGKSGVLA